jgi:signal transduction histidine kinase
MAVCHCAVRNLQSRVKLLRIYFLLGMFLIGELRDERPFLLATLPPSQRQIRLALGIVAALVLVFVLIIPFANNQLPSVAPFVPIYSTVYSINDLITATLFFAQFYIVRRWALLAVAIGFLYAALIVIPHALTFAGAFAPAGLLGARLQSSTWLYYFWKTGIPLALIGYALLKNIDGRTDMLLRSPRFIIFSSIALVISTVGGLTWVATAGEGLLPNILSPDTVQYNGRVVGVFLVSLDAAALALLWFRRNTVLDLWLMVLCCILILDISMSAIIVTGRFRFGWYGACVFTLIGSMVVLLVLLSETTILYANLAVSVMRHRNLQEARQVAMDAMAASIAHEINQPLGAIVAEAATGTSWLDKATPNLDGARVSFEHITREGLRISEIIFAIRSMFKKGAHGRALLGANDLVRETLSMVDLELRKHGISVKADLQNGIPQLLADRGQLQQVFQNLIMNAIEAMSPINNRARVLRVSSGIVQESSQIVVSIEDSGTGIESKDKDRIFEPFFTTKSEGTGIGLAVCRSIIESHDGSLRVFANKPYGTIFQVTFPTGE